MLNNTFVTYENIEQQQPIIDFSEYGQLNPELLNPYSDINLQISGTSFAPKQGLYDSLLGTVSQKSETPQMEDVQTKATSNIPTGDRRSYVKSWLMKNQGLSNEQASALTGVWWAESHLNPGIHEIGKENNPYAGKGIAQWTGRQRQKHAEDIYKQIYGKSKPIKEMSLDEQLNVAIAEFKERGTWKQFLNAKDIKTATDVVWRGYENGYNTLASHELMKKTYGKNYNKQWADRFRFAQEISRI